MSFLLWSGKAMGFRRAGVGLGVAVACGVVAVSVAPSRPFEQPKALAATVLLSLAGLAVLVWAAAMAHVSVQISMYNVRIRHGLVPMPPMTVPLRMVNALQAVDVQSNLAQRWGWTWIPGHGRSVIVRSGPALMFDFGGKQFIVSVDDPETAQAIVTKVR